MFTPKTKKILKSGYEKHHISELKNSPQCFINTCTNEINLKNKIVAKIHKSRL